MPARTALLGWLALIAPVLVGVAILIATPTDDIWWASPGLALVVIVVLTSLCLLGSIGVLILGFRHQLAEIALLGGAMSVASALPLAHGVTIPGALYGPNAAVMTTAFLAIPLGLVAALPLLVPTGAASRLLGRSWRAWSLTSLVAGLAIAAAFLVWPDMVPAPTMGSVEALAVVALSLSGTTVLAVRQLRLYRIGRWPASLVAAAGLTYLGLSSLVWLGVDPFSTAWWLAHFVDATGVLGVAVGLFIAHRRDGAITPTLLPVVNRDPLVALELGLTPIVHRFLQALAHKDRVTRDHVVRVAELAMRSGRRIGLDDVRLRALGLGALLHDIGKLDAPIEILVKPGALTDDEFETMKRHTVWGEALLRPWPLLAPAAPLVRWHHERADGTGYPDGIPVGDLPDAVALISVCDAWDAMVSDRPYRDGMPEDRALAILQDGAGSQWCERAVEIVTAEIADFGRVVTSVFDGVGDGPHAPHDRLCDCQDALPTALLA